MNRTLFLALGLSLFILGCGSGEKDPVPNYGKGKIYESRQATKVLTSAVWCSQVSAFDGSTEAFTFHSNGTGRYAIWNAKSEEVTGDERLWWQLKGDKLSMRIGSRYEQARHEKIRFRSASSKTLVVFLESENEAEISLAQCESSKLKNRRANDAGYR